MSISSWKPKAIDQTYKKYFCKPNFEEWFHLGDISRMIIQARIKESLQY